MRRRTVLALAVLCALGAARAVNIRVLVASAPSVRVRVPINTNTSGLPTAGAPPQNSFAEWTVGVLGAHLSLNGQDGGSASLYLPPAVGSVVGIAGGEYRGGVLLLAAGSKVDAINVLDLEDYLRGVVPAEMPGSWPLEALKAQAVIARTYAVSRLSPGAAYDVCASDQCQVYSGLAREASGTNEAVAGTRGLVISYAGKAARAVFSSDSGGYTASAAEVWGTAFPYLVAQPDPASRGPKSEWTLSVPLAQVAEVAARYGVHLGVLSGVRVTRASPSGRPLELTFSGAQGTATLQGAEAGGFVRALGAYSTRVTLSGDDPLVVTGAGAGHGVGLSQYGASGLAAQRWNYGQILGFYYPGVGLSAVQDNAELPGGASLVSLRPEELLSAPERLRENLQALAQNGAEAR